ncbi:MAG: hypothetical protein GY725_20005 [bacterium]|nr:hypothetical protein [bacterium]
MKFEKEFIVRRSAQETFDVLDADDTIAALFPDTEIVSTEGDTRETLTRFSEMGVSRDIRFLFRRQPDHSISFEKICDGNIWRSLEGGIRVVESGPKLALVQLTMEGSTRALVPEFTIKAPMREQLDQMTKSLRARLEED